MGDEYEQLGPAAASAPFPAQFSSSQPQALQFSPATFSQPPPSPDERTQQLTFDGKKSEVDNKTKKKNDEEVEQDADSVRCLVATIVLFIMIFIDNIRQALFLKLVLLLLWKSNYDNHSK
ncbi:hypothetical protein ACH3XW_36965 [Acanthocheilonema viteae]